jgi:Na+/H+ antiporter NhaD/arsenite permease-like protein
MMKSSLINALRLIIFPLVLILLAAGAASAQDQAAPAELAGPSSPSAPGEDAGADPPAGSAGETAETPAESAVVAAETTETPEPAESAGGMTETPAEPAGIAAETTATPEPEPSGIASETAQTPEPSEIAAETAETPEPAERAGGMTETPAEPAGIAVETAHTPGPAGEAQEHAPGISDQTAHAGTEDPHDDHGLHLDGSALPIPWALPFVGMLLSIALFPLLAAHFWEHHFGKVAIFWALAFLVPATIVLGPAVSLYSAVHTIIAEYVPFIILLLALFAIAGGIRVKGSLCGTPALNTGFLVIGSILASLMGTTGASMLLIRPYLAATAHRRYRVHTVVFFIFLVSNIGGSLTPLGDPPLFLGFLKGVSFFWTTTNVFPQTLFMVVSLLVIFFAVDSFLYKREGRPRIEITEKLGLEGSFNFLLLGGVVGLVLLSGLWRSEGQITVWEDIAYLHSDLVRDLGLLALTFLTVAITPKATRQGNHFTWGPIAEVAKIFGGIFLTMIPVIAILRAGESGALGPLVSLVTGEGGAPVNIAYFWMTGALSSFLDNAPTYLVFFNTAGGDAQTLMSVIPETLAAISCGAVFMGANSYIGNAPNFMVRSISEERGVRMPSFFGYLLWSCGILVPLFIILSLACF